MGKGSEEELVNAMLPYGVCHAEERSIPGYIRIGNNELIVSLPPPSSSSGK